MIVAVPNMRTLSANLMHDWCCAAAREASPEGATAADIAYRAFMIMAFIYGDLALPSRSLH